MYLQWPAYEDMGVVCHCMRPPAFWLVACLHPPPRAQGVTGPPYEGEALRGSQACVMCSRCVLLVRFVDVWDALMDRKGAVQLYHLVGVTGDT